MILVSLLALSLLGQVPAADAPPAIPLGYDAYRQWDRWPLQRIGMRAYMRSTYDRSGGNEGADASHFLYQTGDDRSVTLDVEGPGLLAFVRYNHWHGSPWHYLADGADFVLRETSTADPNHPAPNATFLPASLFPPPIGVTWADTRGADLSWACIPFTDSFRMEYERTHYGTGYYIFDRFAPGARLSHPLRTWDAKTPPPADVVKLIDRAGTDIAPKAGTEGIQERHGAFTLLSGTTAPVVSIQQNASQLRALEFDVPRDKALEFGRARIRVTWDNRALPSVDAPIALFFGAGTLYNRDNRTFLVKALPVWIKYSKERVHLACFFPMPFMEHASIEIVAGDTSIEDVQWSVRWEPCKDPVSHLAYFHATYRDFPAPEAGHDLTLLDTKQVEGGGEWSGSLVGTSFIFSHDAQLGTLEGDPRFFFDDSRTPQAQGTGTEEWGGGGDYWGGRNMTLAFAGHPVGAASPRDAVSPEDRIESAYRYLLGDLMPFGSNARICLEHGGTDESKEHYESVTCWYGAPAPSLVQTDTLNVGNSQSEQLHGYRSPQASAPYTFESRYELGVDHIGTREVFPAEPATGRVTTGDSEFKLDVRPDNFGVLLRRTLDYSFPNQRAEVFVADTSSHWKSAGIWYLAGSNTCIYSNPTQELGLAQHNIETSNRRLRDDEFLLPEKLTRGHDTIRVKVHYTPVDIPLFPGHELPPRGWSEIKYAAYCFELPAWAPAPSPDQ